MKTIIEPHRVKMVEPIRLTDHAEREELIEAARFNPFMLRARRADLDEYATHEDVAVATRGTAKALAAVRNELARMAIEERA